VASAFKWSRHRLPVGIRPAIQYVKRNTIVVHAYRMIRAGFYQRLTWARAYVWDHSDLQLRSSAESDARWQPPASEARLTTTNKGSGEVETRYALPFHRHLLKAGANSVSRHRAGHSLRTLGPLVFLPDERFPLKASCNAMPSFSPNTGNYTVPALEVTKPTAARASSAPEASLIYNLPDW
jgi:hypothetical protein